MSGFLLGTAAFRDWLADDTTLHAWADTQSLPLYASTVSIALLLANVEKMGATQRQLWTDTLVNEAPRRFGPRLRPFDHTAARRWGILRAEAEDSGVSLKGLGSELFVIAIAIAEDLTYLERRKPFHEALPGLKQIDPWTNTSYPT